MRLAQSLRMSVILARSCEMAAGTSAKLVLALTGEAAERLKVRRAAKPTIAANNFIFAKDLDKLACETRL